MASDIIIERAVKNESFAVSALAVHGLITSLEDKELEKSMNAIDMIVPDGQPIRWALNSFYKLGMKDRVYGPNLTLEVLKKANEKSLRVFLFGSTKTTLIKLENFITTEFPKIVISGIHIDRFREASHEEDQDDISKINNAMTNIVLVGRGCPRQEKWVANHKGKINAAMMAVGAAFDFHAGTLSQAPNWMQKNGLEWLYRLIQEPGRLWRRYLITNSKFVYLVLKHKILNKKPI